MLSAAVIALACTAASAAEFANILTLKQSRTFTSVGLSLHNEPTALAFVPNVTAVFGASTFPSFSCALYKFVAAVRTASC